MAVAVVLYHAAWSACSRRQLDALKAEMHGFADQVEVGLFEANDATTDDLWQRGVRAFPTMEMRAKAGPSVTVSGVLTGDALHARIDALRGSRGS